MTNATSNETKRIPAIDATMLKREDGTISGLSIVFGGNTAQTIQVYAHELSEEIRHMCMMHGLKQKLIDAAAISRNPETGRSATVGDKYEAVREVAERLLAGEWNKRREAGEGGTGGLLLRALTRMYAGRMDAEQVKAWLAEKDDKTKAALRKNPQVAAMIETIRAESKDTSGVDTDSLLAELGDMSAEG